jgi:hypothetical protein
MSSVVSSRTWGGGEERRCPICRALSWVEPSINAGDAPCPGCGHLLWPAHKVRQAISRGVHSPARTAYRLGLAVRHAARRIRRAVTASNSSPKPKAVPRAPSPAGVWDPWLDA